MCFERDREPWEAFLSWLHIKLLSLNMAYFGDSVLPVICRINGVKYMSKKLEFPQLRRP